MGRKAVIDPVAAAREAEIVEKIQRHEHLKAMLKPTQKEFDTLHSELKALSEGHNMLTFGPYVLVGSYQTKSGYDVKQSRPWIWSVSEKGEGK